MLKYFLYRGLAYYIDCIIAFAAVMLIFQWGIMMNIRPYLGITDEWFHNSWNLEIYVLTTISLPVWLYFSILDSKLSKGTFGKRIFKLQVTDPKGNKIPYLKSLLRTLLKLLPWEIAHIGVIFPQPLYFSENPEISWLTYAGIGLLLAYIISVFYQPKKRSLYDSPLHTQVEKVKPNME